MTGSPLHIFNNPGIVEAREEPDAILRAGRRPKTGYGVERTDRFWITYARGASQKIHSKLHRDFAPFNTTKRDVEQGNVWSSPATTIRGVLAYADLDASRKIEYSCWRGPRDPRVTNPAANIPWCHGDGENAQRWGGSELKDIECPGEDCPFRQDMPIGRNQTGKPCKPAITVLFSPWWAGTAWEDMGMPSPLFRYHSKNAATAASFRGLIESARQLARDLFANPSFEVVSWFGMPFRLTIGQRTSPKGRYTDVAFSRDGSFTDWLRESHATPPPQLAEGRVVGLLDAKLSNEPWPGLDEDAVSPEAIVSAKPAEVVVPERITEPPGLEVSDLVGRLLERATAVSDDTRRDVIARLGNPEEWDGKAQGRALQMIETAERKAGSP